MQRYEVIAIVAPDVNEDDITAIIERSQNIIESRKGFVVGIDRWGKRRLAYEIKKHKDGFYFLMDFVGDGPIVAEVERHYKIDDRVMKFMTVKKDGASTREDVEKEIAEAEAKRNQARLQTQEGSGEDKISLQDKEAGTAPKKITTREEISKRGE